MKLNEEIINLSKAIVEAVSVDTDTGVIKEKEPGKVYEENLPEGINIETVKRINEYDTNFICAGAHAYGTLAVQAMADNKNLKQLTGELKTVDKNKATFTVDRSREYVNHLKDGEKSVKQGAITTSYEIKAGKNSQQLKLVKNTIAELAMEKLK